TGQVLNWYRDRPGAAFGLLLRKVGFFWNHREPPDNFFLDIFERFTALGRIPLVAWGLVAPLGLAGLLWSLLGREDRRFWVLHAYVLTYFVVNVAFYILSRYRFPAAVGLIPFAALALVRLNELWSGRTRGQAAALVVLMAVCVGFTRLPLIGEEDKAVSHYSMGVIYANKGWKDKAAEQYRASISANPAFKASYLNLGILQAERGRLPESVRALEGALRLERDPRQAELIRTNLEKLRKRLR
ncbi:hypothetical protein ACFL2T_07480, partial [Elusimicrobiota bacterium]